MKIAIVLMGLILISCMDSDCEKKNPNLLMICVDEMKEYAVKGQYS